MKKKFLLFVIYLTFFSILNTPAPVCADTDTSWHGEISFEKTNAKAASRQYCAQADKILNYFNSLPVKTRTDEQKYLTAAKYFYYQAHRIDKSNTDALVGKARIALYENHIRDAKNALSIALNISENNPKITYYLGETFFKDGEFAKALDFYKHAYSHGFNNNFRTNYKLGVTYEKLDEPALAKQHYINALNINPSSKETAERLKNLDMIKTNYSAYKKQIEKKYNKEETIPPEVNEILFGSKRLSDSKFIDYYKQNAPVYLDVLYPFEKDYINLSDYLITPDKKEFMIDLEYLYPEV